MTCDTASRTTSGHENEGDSQSPTGRSHVKDGMYESKKKVTEGAKDWVFMDCEQEVPPLNGLLVQLGVL